MTAIREKNINFRFISLLILLVFCAASPVFATTVSKSRWQQMRSAICNNKLKEVKRLLENGYPINGGTYTTPLALASYCYGGKPKIASYLLDRGANPNVVRTKEDYSPLMWALRSMKQRSDLISRQNRSRTSGDRSFYYYNKYTFKPRRDLVLKMLARGANPTFRARTTRRTPLMLAAGKGDAKLVRLLLRRGANPRLEASPRWGGGNAADQARKGGYVELALEIEGKNSAAYRRGLVYAIKTADTARVRSLIAGGANVNEVEKVSSYTPLHYAAMYRDADSTRLLLEARANPNKRSFAGTTPLREAVVKYQGNIARMLIDAGATANARQKSGCGGGMTEYDWAVNYSQYDLATYMLRKKAADINTIQNSLNRLYGYRKKELPFARYLIKKGLKPSRVHVAKLKGRSKSKIRTQLISIYMEALQPPGRKKTKKGPPEWVIKVRAMPRNSAERRYDDKFRSRTMSKSSETDRVP